MNYEKYEMDYDKRATGSVSASGSNPLKLTLRWPLCQNRFERLGLDAVRSNTVCRGCREDLQSGCSNTRAWSLDADTGEVKPNCSEHDLVYCRHYDCGCDLCANFISGVPVPLAARG